MKNKSTTEIKEAKAKNAPAFNLDQEAGLLVIIQQLGKFHSKDTENVFAKGDCFFKAQKIAGPLFPFWLKSSTGYTSRTAYDYIEIVGKLGPDRNRFIAVGARFTLLKELHSASSEIREAILQRMVDGERVTPEAVRKLKMEEAGQVPVKPKPAYDTPGMSGLKRLVDDKIKLSLVNFLMAVAAVLEGIDKLSVAQARLGRPIGKRDLAVLVASPARIARSYLTHIAAPLIEENRCVISTGFRADSLWNRIYSTLGILASEAELAKQDEVVEWLATHVHPILSTVIDGHAAPSQDRLVVQTPPALDAMDSELVQITEDLGETADLGDVPAQEGSEPEDDGTDEALVVAE